MPKRAQRNDDAELNDFIRQLTESQRNLKGYILAALGNVQDAEEVLQRTNLALWKNARAFRPGAEFLPWAVTIARYEILSFYRDQGRDRHVFVEEVAILMLETAAEDMPDLNGRQEALSFCLGRLADNHRKMLRLRYYEEKSMAQIAGIMSRTENAVKVAFVRIRKSLEECIERRVRRTDVV